MSFHESLHFLQEDVEHRRLQRIANRAERYWLAMQINSTYGKFGGRSHRHSWMTPHHSALLQRIKELKPYT